VKKGKKIKKFRARSASALLPFAFLLLPYFCLPVPEPVETTTGAACVMS
jgi:hypothetical protein